MVWAHNIHIAKGIIDEKLYPYVAGQFLKERLDNNYVWWVVQLRRILPYTANMILPLEVRLQPTLFHKM